MGQTIDEVMGFLREIREAHGNLEVNIVFSTPTNSWEEPLESVDVLQYKNGDKRVGFTTEIYSTN